jgi:hypothetical protein
MTTKDLIPFKKNDPRINRKGRPKSFDMLRSLAVGMASEQAVDKSGEPILLHGKPVTNAQLVLYQWLTDKKYQKDFIEVAFGKVPVAIDLSADVSGAIQVEYVNNPYPITDVPSESSGDTSEPKQV